MQPTTTERELPMLAGIAGFFRWIEELLNILNGPLLMFGAGIALVDLLTDGALTSTDPALLFAWAISQALGIDLQLLACFARARMAVLRQHYWALVGWIVLGIPLAVATWQAGYVYALQQSEHISEAAALAEAGMDRRTWLAWRVGLAVLLVCLAGWTRYVAPRINAQQSAEEERQQLERDLELEPLRQQLRAQQLRGVRGAVNALRGKDSTPATIEEPPPSAQFTPWELLPKRAPHGVPSRPPTGPGSPVTTHPSHAASAQADSLPAGVTDETEQGYDEEENSRVLHIRRSRSARTANARLRRERTHARRNIIRETVRAIMKAARDHGEDVDALSIREIVRRVNASGRLGEGVKTSAKTVKPYIASWLRDQQRAAAK